MARGAHGGVSLHLGQTACAQNILGFLVIEWAVANRPGQEASREEEGGRWKDWTVEGFTEGIEPPFLGQARSSQTATGGV